MPKNANVQCQTLELKLDWLAGEFHGPPGFIHRYFDISGSGGNIFASRSKPQSEHASRVIPQHFDSHPFALAVVERLSIILIKKE